MSRAWIFFLGLACGAAAVVMPRGLGHLHRALQSTRRSDVAQDTARLHTEERFSFLAQGPMQQVAPLFGADKERVWSPDWNPKFIYPVPASDTRGMVFEVAHGHLKSVWVNTELDLKNGRVQYVYMIPEAMVTVITLQLTAADDRTRVDVEYDRTALSPDAEEHVKHMAEGDRGSGPEWERQVNEYLKRAAKQAGTGNP